MADLIVAWFDGVLATGQVVGVALVGLGVVVLVAVWTSHWRRFTYADGVYLLLVGGLVYDPYSVIELNRVLARLVSLVFQDIFGLPAIPPAG